MAKASASHNHRRQDTFEVTSPKPGDTIAVTSGDTPLVIQWSVPQAIADKTVYIALVQGQNVSSLSTVETVNASAPNNGSYTWYSEYNNALYTSSTGRGGAPSGCNYTISLKSWTDEIFSGYFAILNPNDGGLATNATCPQDVGVLRPSNGTYEPISSRSASSSATSSPTGGGSDPSPASNGFSQTTLIVAILVPIVVLLLAFGSLLWLALRRGWLVRPARLQTNARDASAGMKGTSEFGNDVAGQAGILWQRPATSQAPSELPARNGEVHQLYGDESRRAL
ncbi:hypothetical protein LTR36_000073 [Oleoguttula mirabilis]|uniref:Uncharacterized protein n=1 Tax=Oleoguttula mirabilis TaxID=1507867 RepID=A0AAV9JXW8_9PEZI|nr:hypothetical protein LTR36_000073 [Oleoguttula mirabilis]